MIAVVSTTLISLIIPPFYFIFFSNLVLSFYIEFFDEIMKLKENNIVKIFMKVDDVVHVSI